MPSVLVVCMGVCGSGKSTFARLISEALNIPFVEADDIHSEKNKQKMRSGIPLTDADREPWMADVCIQIKAYKKSGCVIAHSALRLKHREQLRSCDLQTYFLYFCAPKNVIEQRNNARKNHFMPTALVSSQFETLESPSGEPDVIEIDASQNIEALTEAVNVRANEIKKQMNYQWNL